MAVVVDRAAGGASLANGSLEVMVHRRTQRDDDRGVGQPINETMCGCRDANQSHIGQCACDGLTIKVQLRLPAVLL
jgi:alpha-mannosidase